MKGRYNKAQEAVEFVLITVLVFFAGLMTVIIFGDKISAFFKGDSSSVKIADKTVSIINPSDNQKFVPDYETNVDIKDIAPICGENNCVINLGEFQLTGVPENFNDYVEAVGASGGTDLIADLMRQLAAHLEAEGKTDQSEAIKKLASFTHNIAVVEKEVEKIANECNYDDNCMDNAIINNTLEGVSEFDTTYMDYPDSHFQHLLNGLEMEYLKKNPERMSYYPLTNNYYTQLAIVNDDLVISDSVKGIINELTWDIDAIGQGFHNLTDVSGDSGISCASLPSYNASGITHFDSALICASGNNTDTGTKCH